MATARGIPASGRLRPVIGNVRPRVDDGRYPAKTSVGELLVIGADVFTDGHDLLRAEVRYQHEGDRRFATVTMSPLGNDRFGAAVGIERTGRYRFQVRAALDEWRTWRRDLFARAGAGQDVTAELAVGAALCDGAATRVRGTGRARLESLAEALRTCRRGLESDSPFAAAEERATTSAPPTLAEVLEDEALAELVAGPLTGPRVVASEMLSVLAERERARFSTWYELFPRSASPDPKRPGTLADVEARLDYVERLGVDICYLPPIHPIGVTHRKGRNGARTAAKGDPGSPWAIGSAHGGHDAIDPALGSMEDFERLVAAAAARGIEVALDLAFQCSPDHPWVTEHPAWFKHRPDGSIRYAENPPKRYEDIYPLDFESEDWQGLWSALLDVVEFWVGHGVSVFRVDNPHTKPFRFWEWLIASVQAEHPEVIFLSEAFTRPKVMYELAKLGFTQSYTYFAWRNSKWELTEYLTELVGEPVVEFFRPCFWPNTPDILTEALQSGRRATFMSRLVLAATMAASYGIYGPVFELLEHEPREPGSEEYLDSEKYAVRHWLLDSPESLAGLVSRVNAIRREHPALQQNRTLCFHAVDNEELIAYSKTSGDDTVLVVVSLDGVHPRSGWVDLDLGALGVTPGVPFEVHDLLTGARYEWAGPRNFVMLDPDVVPAHIFAVSALDTAGATEVDE